MRNSDHDFIPVNFIFKVQPFHEKVNYWQLFLPFCILLSLLCFTTEQTLRPKFNAQYNNYSKEIFTLCSSTRKKPVIL